MPKIVDHDARREEIAQALWRVVRRDGIRAASVRTVAAEAGWSAGAVRYYFPDQDGPAQLRDGPGLPAGCRHRISAIEHHRQPDRDRAALPGEGDPARRANGRPSSTSGCPSSPRPRPSRGAGGLREDLEPVQDGLRGLCRSLLQSFDDAGGLKAGLDLDLESRTSARDHRRPLLTYGDAAGRDHPGAGPRDPRPSPELLATLRKASDCGTYRACPSADKNGRTLTKSLFCVARSPHGDRGGDRRQRNHGGRQVHGLPVARRDDSSTASIFAAMCSAG